MADGLMLVFSGVQAVIVLVTAVFAWLSIKKFRDSRAVDFVIHAESVIDPLYHGLALASPDLIRNVYRTAYDLTQLSDDDVRAFPFMHSLYRQVSRLTFMLVDETIDIGLSRRARGEMIDVWFESLSRYREHPAMQVMHTTSLARGGYNRAFLNRARRVMHIDATSGGGVGVAD